MVCLYFVFMSLNSFNSCQNELHLQYQVCRKTNLASALPPCIRSLTMKFVVKNIANFNSLSQMFFVLKVAQVVRNIYRVFVCRVIIGIKHVDAPNFIKILQKLRPESWMQESKIGTQTEGRKTLYDFVNRSV